MPPQDGSRRADRQMGRGLRRRRGRRRRLERPPPVGDGGDVQTGRADGWLAGWQTSLNVNPRVNLPLIPGKTFTQRNYGNGWLRTLTRRRCTPTVRGVRAVVHVRSLFSGRVV